MEEIACGGVARCSMNTGGPVEELHQNVCCTITAGLQMQMSSSADQTRRTFILAALSATAHAATAVAATTDQENKTGSDEQPQSGDVLVFLEGEHAGEVIRPLALSLGGPPVRAWPRDSKTSVIRNDSRLNEILLARFDPAELDEETRSFAIDGVLAYSAICTHAGCPVTGWLKGTAGDNYVLKCFCHNSEFDPRRSGQVVFGPAPRRLAVLPLSIVDGSLTVAATFLEKPGAKPAG
jgi:Rieske Fe-S protein